MWHEEPGISITTLHHDITYEQTRGPDISDTFITKTPPTYTVRASSIIMNIKKVATHRKHDIHVANLTFRVRQGGFTLAFSFRERPK